MQKNAECMLAGEPFSGKMYKNELKLKI